MTALLRGLVICLFCLFAVASGVARAGERPASADPVAVVAKPGQV